MPSQRSLIRVWYHTAPSPQHPPFNIFFFLKPRSTFLRLVCAFFSVIRTLSLKKLCQFVQGISWDMPISHILYFDSHLKPIVCAMLVLVCGFYHVHRAQPIAILIPIHTEDSAGVMLSPVTWSEKCFGRKGSNFRFRAKRRM